MYIILFFSCRIAWYFYILQDIFKCIFKNFNVAPTSFLSVNREAYFLSLSHHCTLSFPVLSDTVPVTVATPRCWNSRRSLNRLLHSLCALCKKCSILGTPRINRDVQAADVYVQRRPAEVVPQADIYRGEQIVRDLPMLFSWLLFSVRGRLRSTFDRSWMHV